MFKGNYIVIHATGGKKYTTEEQVKIAWANNVDFATPFERNAYMRRTGFEQFGNKMDGVLFNDNGLTVYLENAIV